VAAGTAFDVTVIAQDPFGNPDPTFHGLVQLGSDDANGSVPASYTFTTGAGGDNGQRLFPAGVTLETAGSRNLTVSSGGFADSSAAVAVTAAAATHFIVTAPSTIVSGTPFNVTVTARDAFENMATGYAGTVHFTSDDGLATLPGGYTFTTGAGGDNGIHTFTGAVTLVTGGVHTITANNVGVTGSASVTVQQHISVSLGTSPATPVLGDPVTLTAIVAAGGPATAQPTGTVTFLDNGAVLGMGTVVGGQASLTVTGLGLGTHAFSVLYSGNGLFLASVYPTSFTQTIADQPVDDLTALVSISLGKLKKHGTKAQQTITITSNGTKPFEGPLSLVLDKLNTKIKLVNQTGLTAKKRPAGSPYINVVAAGSVLLPGQKMQITLLFKNPARKSIRFNLRVLGGVGGR
jgi:hypothetical protein